MSCPFRHLWPNGAGEATRASAAAPPPAPAGHTPAADDQQQGAPPPATPTTSANSPPAADAAADEARCPFLAGVAGVAVAPSSTTAGGRAAEAELQPQAQPQQQAQPAGESPEASPSTATVAVCPLGFGSSRQPKLGQFHCLLCKSLYHDCVLTSCGHRYCGGCIRGARDCPACGADIASLERDAETQAMVDKYIEAHAATHTIWELEGSGGEGVDGMAGERSRASFLLQLGLRAIAAGNTDSARHRFQLCQADLQQQLDAAAAEGAGTAELAPLQCRLGAVSGCLGDCCRAEGDAAGTLRHYEESVRLLRAAGQDPEAQQALSVALNKVGELHHLQGDLGAAADLYAQALQLRRTLLAATQQQWHAAAAAAPEPAGQGVRGVSSAEPAAGGEGAAACCSAALDVAASCLKLAGARSGLRAGEEAEALLAEAAALLEGLEGGLPEQPPRLQRKHAAITQYATAMRQPQG